MKEKCVCGHNYSSHSYYVGMEACANCECGEWKKRKLQPVR